MDERPWPRVLLLLGLVLWIMVSVLLLFLPVLRMVYALEVQE